MTKASDVPFSPRRKYSGPIWVLKLRQSLKRWKSIILKPAGGSTGMVRNLPPKPGCAGGTDSAMLMDPLVSILATRAEQGEDALAGRQCVAPTIEAGRDIGHLVVEAGAVGGALDPVVEPRVVEVVELQPERHGAPPGGEPHRAAHGGVEEGTQQPAMDDAQRVEMVRQHAKAADQPAGLVVPLVPGPVMGGVAAAAGELDEAGRPIGRPWRAPL